MLINVFIKGRVDDENCANMPLAIDWSLCAFHERGGVMLDSDERAKILVVDDNPSNISAVEQTLAPLNQTIVSALSGRDALKALMEQEFALILLDVNMPEIDGFETASLISKSDKSSRTPIIFVTAYDDEQSEILKGYSMGGVDYIIKPYIPEILRSKVRIFVELFQAKDEIRKIREREIRTTQKSLHKLQGWQQGSVTAKMAGVGPLRDREAKMFRTFEIEYKTLMDEYVNVAGLDVPPPRQRIQQLAIDLGQLAAGPRDVIDLHLGSVKMKSFEISGEKERKYAVESRLMAMELLGFLVDYYRNLKIIPDTFPKPNLTAIRKPT